MKRRTLSHCLADSRLGLSVAICATFALFPLSTFAAEQKPIDPRADQLLKRMGDFLGHAKFFSVKAEVWQDAQLSSGERVQAGRNIDVRVRRPNRFHSELRSTRHHRELIYDGSALTLLNSAQNFYGTVPATGSLDDAMDLFCEKFGVTMPFEDFVRSDPHKDLLRKVTSGSDIGPVTVLGVPCEHLAFTQDNIDWQVWIQTGPQPVPRKFVITYKDEPDSPQYTAIFSNWDFNTELPDFVFKFEPPPGASKIPVQEIRAENKPQRAE
jgi:Predicted periplasmic protein